jgi:MerR family transcriptional regulator, copper efflux regulator
MSSLEWMIGASCNLSEEDLRRRVAQWSELRGRALEVTPITGGISLTLAAHEPISSVADLVSREAECCPFYGFTLHVDGPTRELAITAGPGGDPAVHALLGLSP